MDEIQIVKVEQPSALKRCIDECIKKQGDGWQVVNAVTTTGQRFVGRNEFTTMYMCTIVFRKK